MPSELTREGIEDIIDRATNSDSEGSPCSRTPRTRQQMADDCERKTVWSTPERVLRAIATSLREEEG